MSAPTQAPPQGASALRLEAARLGISQPGQYALWLGRQVLELRQERERLLRQMKALSGRLWRTG